MTFQVIDETSLATPI